MDSGDRHGGARHGENLLTRNYGLGAPVLVSVLVLSIRVAAANPDIKAVAAAVDAHYNHLRSLEAEFTET